MPNFHPILFKFCAYVIYMLIYKMHREGKFPKTITNLAAHFLELFEPPSYSIEIFFNRKLFCNRRFLRLKLILFLFEYFSKMPVIVIDFMNKFRLNSKFAEKKIFRKKRK